VKPEPEKKVARKRSTGRRRRRTSLRVWKRRR